MSPQPCPKCGSSDTSPESRLRHPKNNTTVGAWRVRYGFIFGGVALTFGLVVLVLGQASSDLFMGQMSVVVAGIALLWAVFILGSTIYLNRWLKVEEMRCHACEHRWPMQDAPLADKQQSLD